MRTFGIGEVKYVSQYITTFITENISCRQINNISKKYNLMFTVLSNPFIENQIKHEGLNYYLAEWIENDFGTAIPNHLRNNDVLPGVLGKELSRYISQQVLKREQTIKSCITNWYHVLSNLLPMGKDNMVGLMSHWYVDTFEKEEVIIKGVVKIDIKDFKNSHILDNIEEDVLYLITNKDVPGSVNGYAQG